MEQEQNTNKIFGVEIDMIARDHLRTITTWARIMAMVGLISVGLTLLRFLANPGQDDTTTLVAVGFFGLIYLVILTLLYVFLLRFANRTNASLDTQNQDQFNSGIGYLATYFKMMGIIIIVILSIGFLALMTYIIGVSLK